MPTCTVLFVLCLPVQVPANNTVVPVEEFHEIAQIDGVRVGSLHTTVVPEQDGKTLRTTASLTLSLERYGTRVQIRREQGNSETSEGRLTGIFMRQGVAGGKQLTLEGSIEDGKMLVKVDGGRIQRRLNWSDEILGLRQQDQFFQLKKVRPGDRLSFLRYEPTYNAVLTVRVLVKERETVDLLGNQQSLVRVELTPDRLETAGQSIQPARTVVWLNEDLQPVRRQTELDGLGTLTLTRTTRARAASGIEGAIDIGARSLVPLNRAIPRPYDSSSAVYRVTVRDEADAARLFAHDDHQSVRGANGKNFELLVHPVKPSGKANAGKSAVEYRSSCRYIEVDGVVRELARRATAGETDAWKKAQRIERWVKRSMQNDNQADLVPSSRIARSLRGDCRHHALLTAAMCRAVEIPSRTAIGLLYVNRDGPKFGFHMWTEVLIDGRWLGVDSTLGRGGVSAAHVKISDHSWYQVESLTPLLPASRVLGKLSIEVLKSE